MHICQDEIAVLASLLGGAGAMRWILYYFRRFQVELVCLAAGIAVVSSLLVFLLAWIVSTWS